MIINVIAIEIIVSREWKHLHMEVVSARNILILNSTRKAVKKPKNLKLVWPIKLVILSNTRKKVLKIFAVTSQYYFSRFLHKQIT